MRKKEEEKSTGIFDPSQWKLELRVKTGLHALLLLLLLLLLQQLLLVQLPLMVCVGSGRSLLLLLLHDLHVVVVRVGMGRGGMGGVHIGMSG